MQKIKVGIWGLGNAGRRMYIRELAMYPDMFEIVAGYDAVEENLQAAAEQLPQMKKYFSSEELLADPEVELVTIATRSVDHVSHALQALAAGKFVSLEKPIAVSYAGVLKLKAAADQYPGKLYFRHNRRFEPQFQCVREICDSGVLGNVFEVKLHRHSFNEGGSWQSQIAQGGGYLNNWGPHVIDHALLFLDSPVASQSGYLRKVAGTGDAEDHAKIILTGENGRIVDLEVSCGVALGQSEYLIFGDKGALTCKGLDVALKYLKPEQKETDGLEWIEKEIHIDPKNWDNTTSIWKYLYESIREDSPFPITINHAVEIVRICDEAKKGTPFQLQ